MDEAARRARIAHELLPALDLLPAFEIGENLVALRGALATLERAPVPPALEVVTCTELAIPGPADSPAIRVLRYVPPGLAAGQRAAVLHIHGGGYVIGSPEIHDIPNRAMALAVDCEIFSVDYRLAPETAFPGARDDCYTVLCWMHDHAAELGIDPARIAAAGESAGGGHCVALALHARNITRRQPDAPQLSFLVLDAPMLDDRTGSDAQPDAHPHCGHFVWTAKNNRAGWSALLGVPAGSPQVPSGSVPAREADLAGLPPVFVSVGALDLFLEEDLEFVRRLTRAGTAVELYVVPGAFHGFTAVPGPPQVTQVNQLRDAALKRVFARD